MSTDLIPATEPSQANRNWRALRERLIQERAGLRVDRDEFDRRREVAGHKRASMLIGAFGHVLDLMDEFERAGLRCDLETPEENDR